MRIIGLLGSIAAILAATLTPPVSAQTYPTKSIRMIVPFPPGGPADLLGRLVGQKLQEAWGQPVVADNRAGAGGNIGMEAAARAPGDGYTLVVAPAGNLTVVPHIQKLSFDVTKDLAPITLLATVTNVLVVHPSIPAANMAELIQHAKARPGTLSYATPGAGSQAHLAGEFLKIMAGIDLLHVPYRGTGPALNDLLGGQVSMMFSQLSSALPHVQAGKLRALGIASLKRSPVMPALPTVAEQNLAGFEAVSWYALMASAGTPADIIAKLHGEVARALKQPDVVEKLTALGADPVGGSPGELADLIRTESARWAKVVKDANIKAE
ncbi:MAG: tripartite tricarboxylate transporter substrate binding protein [Alphaproteobacteria bacterium]|nr:tripartite tricarboxylate transporter substrate binding protein [Alphaproteobacteria bacterium]